MSPASLIYDLPEADHHAHPALSSTGARRLLRPGCPALFDWERQHPRPAAEAMKLGRAAHREVLGVGSDFALTDKWDNFRTDAAREWRDQAEVDGLIPMLTNSSKWERVQGMKTALLAHASYRRLFDPERGHAEVSAFWVDDETGVDCRARFDFLPDPIKGRRLVIADYKKTTDPDPGDAHAAQTAAAVCHTCPVRADCLDYAMTVEVQQDRHGVWGGLTPTARNRLWHEQRKEAA